MGRSDRDDAARGEDDGFTVFLPVHFEEQYGSFVDARGQIVLMTASLHTWPKKMRAVFGQKVADLINEHWVVRERDEWEDWL